MSMTIRSLRASEDKGKGRIRAQAGDDRNRQRRRPPRSRGSSKKSPWSNPRRKSSGSERKRAPTGTYVIPYRGTITSRFGWVFRGRYEFHTGIDCRAQGLGHRRLRRRYGRQIRWYGSYGYCDNRPRQGDPTLYGHCLKLSSGRRQGRAGRSDRPCGKHRTQHRALCALRYAQRKSGRPREVPLEITSINTLHMKT